RLFVGGNVVWVGLLIWGGLFAAAFVLIDPQSAVLVDRGPAGHVALAAGIGLVAAVVVLTAAWSIAVSRSDRAFRPVRQGMADAQAHQQAWMRFAKDDLQRSERQYRDRYAAL